ncbi:hypothetical protein HanRHA438_Chr07g0294821 [Helianthus annuus]|nr:hypothetical protein HanRHA438_Chr07g0294821 [Helianthus annuus]
MLKWWFTYEIEILGFRRVTANFWLKYMLKQGYLVASLTKYTTTTWSNDNMKTINICHPLLVAFDNT